jgi:AcrR family transcriptional regulator
MSARIDHESRRLEIAFKAMKLFSQVGYDNVSLIMVASAAGVARTVLYRYFRSKREVLDAAILAVTQQIMKDSRKELSSRGKASDRLSMVCYHVADVLFEKKEFLSAIFDFVLSMVRSGEDMGARIQRFTGGIKSIFERLITEGAIKGEFDPDVNPERAAEGFYSLLESCVLRIVLGTESNSAQIKVRVSDMVRAISVSPADNAQSQGGKWAAKRIS